MAKVLIVDDDENLVVVLSNLLRAEKHVVDIAMSGDVGLNYLLDGNYDLAILDISMPVLDGMTVCQNYRQAGGDCHIIMLTGKRSQEDKIIGLDLGADDYITKPFDARELVSRVRALLRRPAAMTQVETLQCGKLTIDLKSHVISCAGRPVQLAPREYALLEFFMRNPNHLFSAESLLARVWQSDSDAAIEAVRNSVNRLRGSLKGWADSGVKLETVYAVGYRLTVE